MMENRKGYIFEASEPNLSIKIYTLKCVDDSLTTTGLELRG